MVSLNVPLANVRAFANVVLREKAVLLTTTSSTEFLESPLSTVTALNRVLVAVVPLISRFSDPVKTTFAYRFAAGKKSNIPLLVRFPDIVTRLATEDPPVDTLNALPDEITTSPLTVIFCARPFGN